MKSKSAIESADKESTDKKATSPSSLAEPQSPTASHEQPTVRGWKRVAFLFAAAFFFALGVCGAIFPVLPTTPFLLLTSYFLLRASPALNKRLLRSKFFGPILTDWQERRGIRRDIKVKAIVVVCLAVGASIYFSLGSPLLIGVVCVAALIGIGVIVRLPSL